MNNKDAQPVSTAVSAQQLADKKYKIGVDMVKEGIAAQNHSLIRGGISYLQTAASVDERAKHCLSRLKTTANPGSRHVIVLQDPSQLHFSAWEISKLCKSIDESNLA